MPQRRLAFAASPNWESPKHNLTAANGHKEAAECQDSDARKLSSADLFSAE